VGDEADSWFHRSTSRSAAWPVARVLAAKQASGQSVSVVIPARDEAATVGAIVRAIVTDLVEPGGLVDEVLVMDSDSSDDTADVARDAGATVYRSADGAPELGSFPGKGEAMWKALFVSRGTLIVFIDADLTVWTPQFVVSLLGPLLDRPETLLVKGFYRRLLGTGDGETEPGGTGHGGTGHGGRVTELVARPLLNLWWPALASVVQPLAGEWAARRSLLETLPVPVGYGVELAALLDTYERHGTGALAQVDLGRRGHLHQSVQDLGVMAAELMGVAQRRIARSGGLPPLAGPAGSTLRQFDPAAGWTVRPVPTAERPPAAVVPAYPRRRDLSWAASPC
jgi:glucosyl-3-phosphoglycerate synthase